MQHVPLNPYHETKNQSGQILLLALVFMVVVMTAVGSLVGYAGLQIKAHRQAVAAEQGLNIAEAGAELAIWKLNNQGGYSGEVNSSYGNGTYTVTITSLSGNTKLIKIDSYVPNVANPTAHRIIQITASIGTINLGFNYGVQVGDGGLDMSNSSKIVGNVYSDGDIVGRNSASITGTAITAGAGTSISSIQIDGNATSHTISNTDVGGNVNAVSYSDGTVDGNAVVDSLSSCTVQGNATYDTKSSCNVNGTPTTPNPTNFVEPDSQPLPITQDQIDAWQAEAVAGGTIGSQSYSSGTVSLGPKKINGDLTISNTATLTITGTLWVTGSINILNSGIAQLSSTYGNLSGVIMAGTQGSTSAGAITIANSSQILGSGTAGSYVLILSQMAGTTNTAIASSNTGSAGILYAGTGKINLSNSGHYKEVTAYFLDVNNTASVTYESGLASSQFSSGPAGGWEISKPSWQLLQ